MIEVLHPAAIGLTTIAAAVHPGWRRRGALLGLFAALLMLAAMVDVVVFGSIATMAWVAALVAGSLALSAADAVRRRRVGGDAAPPAVGATLDALGLIVMAALLPMMVPGPQAADATGHAVHAAGATGLAVLTVAAAASHVTASVVAAARGIRWSDRIMQLLMGGATLAMTAHLFVDLR